jgi:predicted RNA-binding protein with PIN domain
MYLGKELMPIHIIVDGYNFIRRSRHLNNLDRQDILLGREALQEMLSAYKKAKRHRITVVFDGQNALPSPGRHVQAKGIQIIFSRNGRTADDVIKQIASQEREKALIVSSDNEVVEFCTSQGAAVIRSEAFENSVYQAVYSSGSGSDMERTADERKPGTKKKGPAKRLSKKERRHGRKVVKL